MLALTNLQIGNLQSSKLAVAGASFGRNFNQQSELKAVVMCLVNDLTYSPPFVGAA